MKFFTKFFCWILLMVVIVAINSPLFAQVPPPTATPIDGISGAVAVIVIGAGLAAGNIAKTKRNYKNPAPVAFLF